MQQKKVKRARQPAVVACSLERKVARQSSSARLLFPPLRYRPEIGGLRTIALISVVLHHFTFQRAVSLAGGCAEVGVFFVIYIAVLSIVFAAGWCTLMSDVFHPLCQATDLGGSDRRR
jgi:hypothetical protein